MNLSLKKNKFYISATIKNHMNLIKPGLSIIQTREYRKGNQKRKILEKPSFGTVASIGAGATFLFGKAKYLLVAAKLTKVTPLLSMILTSGTYALFFGPQFGVGMVGLIFIHELGHVLPMRYYKMDFSPMVFIPFVGASIQMNQHPKSAWEEAIIAFGGPMLGGVAAGGVATYASIYDSQFGYALADFGYMINLFNMLPIGSMDGGRIASSISPYFSGAGLVAGGYIAATGMIMNPIFYLILLMGGYEAVARFMGWNSMPPNYYRLTYARQAALAGGYVAVIAALFLGIDINSFDLRI